VLAPLRAAAAWPHRRWDSRAAPPLLCAAARARRRRPPRRLGARAGPTGPPPASRRADRRRPAAAAGPFSPAPGAPPPLRCAWLGGEDAPPTDQRGPLVSGGSRVDFSLFVD